MLERFRAESPEGDMRIKADEPLVIQIKQSAGWDEATINLHRVFGFCRNSSAQDCESVKSEFVTKLSRTSKPQPPDPKALRIIVRDEDYVQYLRNTFPDSGKQPPVRQIGDKLFALLAFDSADAIAVANADLLREAGLSADQAWAKAMAQTRDIFPPVPKHKLAAKQPVAFQDSEYLASMLAFTDDWEELAKSAGPELFATAVSDNFVFIGFMPDGARLTDFKKTVEEDCRAQQRCVSPFVFRFREGRWRVAD